MRRGAEGGEAGGKGTPEPGARGQGTGGPRGAAGEGRAPADSSSLSLPGAQGQGHDEAHDQQEHGDREQHCDDHHAPCPGHSQPNGVRLPSCQTRKQGGLGGQRPCPA